jgi:ubiquinone/menaquinone biosynthesis C-methylase UbiE
MSDLEVSGERMIEDAYVRSLDAYVIYIMHTASYAFAQKFCVGKVVLDLGCGSGYGAARIGKIAARVEGVDVDEEAVAFAQERYSSENVSFSSIEVGKALPFPDASFDTVLSFQVIEHVQDDDGYLMEAHRVLKPGGVLVVVTPDRQNRLLPTQRPWNRWHVREYSGVQLERKVARRFDVEASLKMGAAWEVAGVELRRYRKTKWLTLPFTLPILPDVVRRKALDILHRLRAKPGKVGAGEKMPVTRFEFDDTAMLVEKNPPNSLNLVLVCRKGAE